MPAEVVAHLFDPYFTTKGDAGTGLGVPQVLAFMRASGGTVCVSTEPGAGTRFDLRFPAADPSEPAGDSHWRQLDRWTNEGGSVKTARRSHARRKVRRRRSASSPAALPDRTDPATRPECRKCEVGSQTDAKEPGNGRQHQGSEHQAQAGVRASRES
jgi:hypothetical protein